MNRFSDIVCDLKKSYVSEFGKFAKGGESTFEHYKFGLVLENYEIATKAESEMFDKPKGKYSLVSLPNLVEVRETAFKYYVRFLADVIKDYLGQLSSGDKVCVVGLGNKYISADSLGIEVVKNIIVTQNLVDGALPVCAFLPSVLGVTGIESKDVVDGILAKVKPTKVILIDSLCASHISRLGTSIQITNSGLVPGSGVGNSRKRMNKSTLNCDVLAIGVPMVIYASTFIYSAFVDVGLNEASLDKISGKFLHALKASGATEEEVKDGASFFGKLEKILHNKFNDSIVSLKDVDILIKAVGKLIGEAINLAVLGRTKN